MKTIRTSAAVIAGVLAIGVAVAARPMPDAASEAEPKADPRAIAALETMGAFLRDQQSFAVRATTQTDYVLDTGQKIRLGSQANVQVHRPDRLRADVTSDRKERQFFYDGKTFTIYGPRLGLYASVAAPPTILEVADKLEDTYGLALPLVDLFRWGTGESDLGEITAATYVGTTLIDGVETDQYAFRQPGLDWQIWIQRGDRPLPRKLLLTATDDRSRPEYAVDLSWDLAAKPAPAAFAFVPPKASKRIALAELGVPPLDAVRKR